jgi:hypothetical protein
VPSVPVVPGFDRCQHCYSNVRQDALGVLREVSKAGYLAERFCPGASALQHKLLPKVNTDA